jgi:hypothetical protein
MPVPIFCARQFMCQLEAHFNPPFSYHVPNGPTTHGVFDLYPQNLPNLGEKSTDPTPCAACTSESQCKGMILCSVGVTIHRREHRLLFQCCLSLLQRRFCSVFAHSGALESLSKIDLFLLLGGKLSMELLDGGEKCVNMERVASKRPCGIMPDGGSIYHLIPVMRSSNPKEQSVARK